MRNRKFLIIIFLGTLTSFLMVRDNNRDEQKSLFIEFNNKANAFFPKYVAGGKVAYNKIKNEGFATLTYFLETIASMDMSSLTPSEKKSFYINSYNILVIALVVDNLPLKKPLDKKGFFDVIKHSVAGEQLTLNDIENRKIRAVYKDARTHFALVCAAKGCPSLQNFAYTPADLDAQLDKVTQQSMDSETFTKYNPRIGRLEISKIFEWYTKDFGDNRQDIIDFINKYRTKNVNITSFDYYPYDWNLNNQ